MFGECLHEVALESGVLDVLEEPLDDCEHLLGVALLDLLVEELLHAVVLLCREPQTLSLAPGLVLRERSELLVEGAALTQQQVVDVHLGLAVALDQLVQPGEQRQLVHSPERLHEFLSLDGQSGV